MQAEAPGAPTTKRASVPPDMAVTVLSVSPWIAPLIEGVLCSSRLEDFLVVKPCGRAPQPIRDPTPHRLQSRRSDAAARVAGRRPAPLESKPDTRRHGFHTSSTRPLPVGSRRKQSPSPHRADESARLLGRMNVRARIALAPQR